MVKAVKKASSDSRPISPAGGAGGGSASTPRRSARLSMEPAELAALDKHGNLKTFRPDDDEGLGEEDASGLITLESQRNGVTSPKPASERFTRGAGRKRGLADGIQTGRSSWLRLLIQAALAYALIAVLFICPHEKDTHNPVCKAAFSLQGHLGPHAQPYIDKASPYVNQAHSVYKQHGAPLVDHADKLSRPYRKHVEVLYDTHITKNLHKIDEHGEKFYRANLHPYTQNIYGNAEKMLDPVRRHAQGVYSRAEPGFRQAYTSAGPALKNVYTQAQPYAQKTAQIGRENYHKHLHPRLISSYEVIKVYYARHLQPVLARIWALYIQPQIDRIHQWVFEYKTRAAGRERSSQAHSEAKEAAKVASKPSHSLQETAKINLDAKLISYEAQLEKLYTDRQDSLKERIAEIAVASNEEADAFFQSKSQEVQAAADSARSAVQKYFTKASRDHRSLLEDQMADADIVIAKESSKVEDTFQQVVEGQAKILDKYNGFVTVAVGLIQEELQRVANDGQTDLDKDISIIGVDTMSYSEKKRYGRLAGRARDLSLKLESWSTSTPEYRKSSASLKSLLDNGLNSVKNSLRSGQSVLQNERKVGESLMKSARAEASSAASAASRASISASSAGDAMTESASSLYADVQAKAASLGAAIGADGVYSAASDSVESFLGRSSASGVAASISSLVHDATKPVVEALGGTPSPVGLGESVASFASVASSSASSIAKDAYASAASAVSDASPIADSLGSQASSVLHHATRSAAYAVGATPSAEGLKEHIESLGLAGSEAAASLAAGLGLGQKAATDRYYDSVSSAAEQVASSASSLYSAGTPSVLKDAASSVSSVASVASVSGASVLSEASKSASSLASDLEGASLVSSATSILGSASSSASVAASHASGSASSALSVASASASSYVSGLSIDSLASQASKSAASVASSASSIALGGSVLSSASSLASHASKSMSSAASDVSSRISKVSLGSSVSSFASEASKSVNSAASDVSSMINGGSVGSSASSLASKASVIGESMAADASEYADEALRSAQSALGFEPTPTDVAGSISSIAAHASKSISSFVASPSQGTVESLVSEASDAVKSALGREDL